MNPLTWLRIWAARQRIADYQGEIERRIKEADRLPQTLRAFRLDIADLERHIDRLRGHKATPPRMVTLLPRDK